MKVFKDVFGERYGILTVLKYWDIDKNGKSRWLCFCDCGVFKVIVARSLKAGLTKSCGCQVGVKARERVRTHGKSESREHNSWRGMKERCTNPKNSHYPLYGGRGISYCEEWELFENFYKDMGDCPDGYQLERCDVNLGYSKDNCIWDDKTQQAFNIRLKSNNTTGRTGVYQKDGKWYAVISYYKKVITFSFCDSYEDACIAREFAELCLYGFIKEEYANSTGD